MNKTISRIDTYLDKLEEKKIHMYTEEDLDMLDLDEEVKERLMEAKKVFVSAYWSGNVLKWRTEDGRMGSDPMKKTKDKDFIKKHLKKVLGSNIELELIKEGFVMESGRKVGGKEYDKFFKEMLKKWKIKSYKDLPRDKQMKFFDEVDSAWNSKKEKGKDGKN